MSFHKNPLNIISDRFTWADYKVFKAHLRLPLPYLVVLFRNYNTAHEMVINLPKLIKKYDEYLWGKMSSKTMIEKMYEIASIPPMFTKDQIVICTKAKEQELFEVLVTNANKLVGTGKQLYFYSTFMEGAMFAAFKIARAAINSNLQNAAAFLTSGPKIYSCNLGNYLETFKESWDAKSALIKSAREAELLILYGVGNEYATEFTSNYLLALLDQRAIEGRSTIVVSSLVPSDFSRRYGKDFNGTVIQFQDNKIKQTLADLAEELMK